MVRNYIFIALLLFSSFVRADEWHIAANTLLVVDWLQTREISNNPNYYETNKILGRYPTRKQVDAYFILYTGSVNIIGEVILPTEYQNIWYGIITINQLYYVIHNKQIGIKIGF